MKFTKIRLITPSGCPEALTNMLYDYDETIITDMIEDSKDINEVFNSLTKLYAKIGRGSILRKPIEIRSTDEYDRIKLCDGLNNISYLKIFKN